jgi:hypothetical protein
MCADWSFIRAVSHIHRLFVNKLVWVRPPIACFFFPDMGLAEIPYPGIKSRQTGLAQVGLTGVSGRLAIFCFAEAYFRRVGPLSHIGAGARTRASFGLFPRRLIGHNYLYGIFSTDSLAQFIFVCRFRASRVASPAPSNLFACAASALRASRPPPRPGWRASVPVVSDWLRP